VPPYDAEQMAQGLAEQLAVFLFSLLVQLDHLLDKRLVRTFLHTICLSGSRRRPVLKRIGWLQARARTRPQQEPNA